MNCSVRSNLALAAFIASMIDRSTYIIGPYRKVYVILRQTFLAWSGPITFLIAIMQVLARLVLIAGATGNTCEERKEGTMQLLQEW